MADLVSYLIVGNGIAGVTAAEILRAEDPEAAIAVVADDPFPVYYRPALKDYLAGRIHEEKLWARPTSLYQDQRIHFLQDRVTSIQAEQHIAYLQSGRQLAYKQLLLANGAHPATLRCPGTGLQGVTTLRTVADYQSLMQCLDGANHVVIVGGGTLALETSETLRHRGYEVTHLIRKRTLWSEILDETASDLVLQQERRAGVTVRLETEVAEIVGKHGQVNEVTTTRGERIPCEVVIIAIGIEPDIDFIKASGIHCGRGVQVDAAMRTNVPDIYAAGDVLETIDTFTRRTRVIGQWYPAIQQARSAAYSMLHALDDAQQPFQANTFYNATLLYSLDFAAIGVTNRQGYQELVADPQPRTYRKLLLEDGVPVGMLALGDRSQALAFKRAIDHRVNLASISLQLLNPDFQLAAWLDQQMVPPALLGVQHAKLKPKAAQVAPRTVPVDTTTPHAIVVPIETVPRALQEKVQGPVPTELVLVHVPDRVSGLNLPDFVLKQSASLTIGRAPGTSLLIDQGTVSRRHAEIAYAHGCYVVQDLGSSNGTFVNEQALAPHSVRVLQPNDMVRFGRYVTFRFIARSCTGNIQSYKSVPSSQMTDVNGRVSTDALTEDVRAYSTEKVLVPTAQVRLCQRCRVVNTHSARFCAGCSAPLGSGIR
ncbi:MAG TPA: FAD-dependent oxidoreductase [Ktedonobacteraceae bacterium]|nr:FAD-dependent oxidoreductase [Ktedonobacteraceae bacterium]